MMKTIMTLLFLLITTNAQFLIKSEKEIKNIHNVMQEYRKAWKLGNSKKIMNTLSDNVVLFQPTKNGKPILGKEELKKFWFPNSDIKYPIIDYKVSHPQVEVSGNLAFYQGLSELTWFTLENEIAKDTITSISEFTTILKKENQSWKIYRIMYNLKDSNYKR